MDSRKIHGMLQARILEWVATSSSRGSSWPRDRTCVSWVCPTDGQVVHIWATWEALCSHWQTCPFPALDAWKLSIFSYILTFLPLTFEISSPFLLGILSLILWLMAAHTFKRREGFFPLPHQKLSPPSVDIITPLLLKQKCSLLSFTRPPELLIYIWILFFKVFILLY